MTNYLKNWNFMRIFRLLMGIFIIVTGIQVKDWLFVSLGVIFSAMPIFNIGCCGVNSCGTTVCRSPKGSGRTLHEEEISYEEVK